MKKENIGHYELRKALREGRVIFDDGFLGETAKEKKEIKSLKQEIRVLKEALRINSDTQAVAHSHIFKADRDKLRKWSRKYNNLNDKNKEKEYKKIIFQQKVLREQSEQIKSLAQRVARLERE